MTITPATLTVTANPQTKVYGANDPTLTYTTSGLVNMTVDGLAIDDTAASVLSGSLARATAGTLGGEQVGSYAISQGSLAPNSDYTISFIATQLTITPATLTVTANAQTKVYGANDSTLTYTTSGLVNTTVGGLAIDDTAASVLSGSLARATAGTLGGEQVGSYAISQGSLAPNSDYTISFAGNLLTITPATLTVTANAQTKVYGANDPTLTYTTSGLVNTIVDGLAMDDTAASVLTGALARTAAGTLGGEQVDSYAITQGSLASNSDYTISFTGKLLTITPALLTIDATSDWKVYNGTTGSSQTPTYSTLYNGDTIAGLTQAFASKNVLGSGSSTLNVTGYTINDGDDGKDYAVKLVSATGTITPTALTISAASQTKVYDGTTTSTAVPTYSGLITEGGDTITGLTQAYASENVLGTNGSTLKATGYTINDGDGGEDYTVTLVSATGTISPAPLTITADNETKTVGTTYTFNSTQFTTSGLFSGDSVTSVTLTSAGAAASAMVGGYPIMPSLAVGSGLGNYTISYVNGTLTVVASSWETNGTIYVLDPTAGGALTLSGSASINVTGDVIVDSNSSSAISVSGAPSVKAAEIHVVGGVQKIGSPTFNPQPVTGSQVMPDPLAWIPYPAIPTALTSYGSKSIGGSLSVTLQPGIYSSISVSGAAKAMLAGGTYVIQGGGFAAAGSAVVTINSGTTIILEGGGLSVSGAATVRGTGVTIFNFGTSYNGTTDGGTFGPITLSGSGSFNLSPATSGTYAGILIFQGRDNTKALTFSGTAMQGVTGLIYAPDASLVESGSAQVGSTSNPISIVVDTLTLSGAAIADGLGSSDGAIAYSPSQIRDAYGVNSLAEDGSGETIAIVDAYDVPLIDQAVNTFDSQFSMTDSGESLYDHYGPASAFLTVVNQNGQATSLPGTDPSGPGTANWEMEEELDVEWAHAVAPGADHPCRSQQSVALRLDGQRSHGGQPAGRFGGVDELGLRRRAVGLCGRRGQVRPGLQRPRRDLCCQHR